MSKGDDQVWIAQHLGNNHGAQGMSTIDEIMAQADAYASAMYKTDEREPLSDLIAAALADARREGAEQMREAAADAGYAAAFGSKDVREVYKAIRAIPLPTGERQAVLLTDEQILTVRKATKPLPQQWGETLALSRAIETAVLAANNLEVRRG